MKKFILILSVFFISFFAVFSAEIQGRIVNNETKSPLEFVTVSIIEKNSQKSIAGAITNNMGVFNISSVNAGDYVLKVTFIGFKAVNKNITVNNQILELGEIPLEEDSKTLKEVEVVGQGSQMRFGIDKKVFSVDQNIASSGGSATEVLQNIPSVNVDNEGNVSLRNNENVEVWINGKPSGLTAENRAQVLQQMPAESIESIEIMTNPSAKFSPEGTAGIINLVMKKDRKAGYFGSVGAGIMLANGNKLGGNTDFSINYSNNKIETFANIGLRKMSMEGNSITERTNFNNADTTVLTQNSTSTRSFGGLFYRAGIDYHIDNKNTIGFSGFGMIGKMGNDEDVNYLQIRKNTTDTLRKYIRNNTSDANHPGYHLNAYHKIDFDKIGSNLITNLSFSGHNMEFDNNYVETVLIPSVSNDNISQNATNNNNEIELKTDYTKKFNENDRLELGWNSNFERRKSTANGLNNLTKSEIDTYFNDFTNDEWIHAAYFTYGKKINNFSAQVGLRGEYQIRDIKTTSYNDTSIYHPKSDFELFPSMYLAYSLPKNNEIQLNYTRRVNRPRGRQINSFRDYSDPTMVSFGNPLLTPEYASSFELNYLKNWDNHTLSASAYYRFTTDVIRSVNFMEDNILQSTYMNLTKQQNTGMELVAKNRLLTILNLTSSLNLYYSKIDPSVYVTSENVNVNIDGQENFTWDAKMIANILFGRTFSGQLTAQYIAPQVIGQGKQYEMYSVDFGLRKTFFDRKFTLALTGRDIFNTRKIKTSTSGNGFIQNYESLKGGRMGGGRVIGLTATYSFGNMKPKSQEKGKQQNQNSNTEMEIED
ncbi:TonB-dependent receptor [uncultured Paludibacter sp.]|nr:TonB-dependent receptor [uncultured Paludibacter sp.]